MIRPPTADMFHICMIFTHIFNVSRP